MTNFAHNGFNDRVNSAVVHDGRWEICVDADFRGSCSVLAPGAYPNLGAYAGRISSVRPIEERYSGNRSDDRGRNREARATLYEGPNLSGRAFPLNDIVRNLGTTGFNDRASSLRVESGYWIFCSDSEFRGECRTYGPGEYVSLPGLNNVISSGRRISNDYPYGEQAGLATRFVAPIAVQPESSIAFWRISRKPGAQLRPGFFWSPIA